MKIAIVTANIGKFDPIYGITKQKHDIDFFYYTENNLPFALPNLDNRLKSKYIKICMHRFLKDYDFYIWVDGRIKIVADTFAEVILQEAENFDAVFYKHRERKSVYLEYDYILNALRDGASYIISRYANQLMNKEKEFFESEKVPLNAQLYMTGIFGRWNNEKTNKCFDEWWQRCIEFSYFDQAMLSYIEHNHNLKINGLNYDEIRTHKLFTITKHI